jgi:hypothetical protein
MFPGEFHSSIFVSIFGDTAQSVKSLFWRILFNFFGSNINASLEECITPIIRVKRIGELEML